MIDDAVANKKRFIDAMRALCATFEKDPSVDLLKAYAIGLKGLTADEVDQAVALAIRGKRFFPRPAELLELVGRAIASERTIQSVALEAFDHLAAALTHVGTYKSIEFDDPILAATVDHLGGWVYLGTLSESRFYEFTRPQFVRAYVSFSVSLRPIANRRIVGITAKENERPEQAVHVAPGFAARRIGADPRRFEVSYQSGEYLPIAARVRLAITQKDF